MNFIERPDEFPRGCFLPLHTLAVHPQGRVHFCLTSKLPPGKDLAELEAQRLEVHHQLLKGDWPESCRSCRAREEKGLMSRRTGAWQRRFNRYGRAEATRMVAEGTRSQLRHIELSFSNLCNLDCAMCSSEFSSRWIRSDRGALEQGLEFRGFTRPFTEIKRLAPEVIDAIFSQVNELTDLIVIKGGEPSRDPRCIDFLHRLAKLPAGQKRPWLFIQSNGTRAPDEWLKGLEGLKMELGCSMDGWGPVYEWVRGASFERVLANFRALDRFDCVQGITVDFALSAHNCYQAPEFLRNILRLREEHPKLHECAVFQWVQQPYATALALPLEKRLRVLEEVRPIFRAHREFFVGWENMERVLAMPQSSEVGRDKAKRWMHYMNTLRTRPLHEAAPEAAADLLSAPDLAPAGPRTDPAATEPLPSSPLRSPPPA